VDPGPYDLNLYRGDTYRWRYKLWEDESKTTPVDLTGAAVAAEFRDKTGGSKVMVMGVIVTLPNTVDVEITKPMWDGAPNGGLWDLEAEWSPEDVRTFVGGRVSVTGDATNSKVNK
jgi:hypothetical protein